MCLVGVDQLSRRQWRGECIVHDLNHLLWEILRYECCQSYCPRRRRSGLGTHRWSQTQGFPEIHNNKATGVLIVILQHWKIHRNKYLLINLIRYYQRSKKWMQIQSPWIISFWNKLICKSWSTKIHFFYFAHKWRTEGTGTLLLTRIPCNVPMWYIPTSMRDT